MPPLKFYYDLRSQPCRAVYIFLKANKIDFEAVHVDLFSGEHLQEAFTKVNPYKRVPVIDDDGFVLSESIAIMKYVCKKYRVAELWCPDSRLEKEARLEEYLHWHHVNIRYITMMLFRHEYIDTLRGRPVRHEEVDRFKNEFLKAIKHLDEYFLKDQEYICGNEVSIVDLVAVCELTQLYGTLRENLFLDNPKLRQWYTRIQTRLNPYFNEAHQAVTQMKELYEQSRTSKI